ncbi:MAG: LAGLIDADG family homing endonuclease [Candidatus Paceibacterota bacterium]
MARRWTKTEEKKHYSSLFALYVKENKSLKDIAKILNLSESTVFLRLKRLGIKTNPSSKKFYLNRRSDLSTPKVRNEDMAELFGILLGDGHISHFQVSVTLGTKELEYVQYICSLMNKIFGVCPKVCLRKTGHRDVYLGSVFLTNWFLKHGLVNNKVKSQVGVPKWIFSRKVFMNRFLRGFFDTDGSIYKLRFGIQISFNNRSMPLLQSSQIMLKRLGYKSSEVSSYKVYLTKISDVKRFFLDISPKNQKHQRRYQEFIKPITRRSDSGYSRRL